MTSLKFVICTLVLCICIPVYATDMTAEVGTYKKTTRRIESVIDSVGIDSTIHIFRSRFNGHYDKRHYNGKRDNALLIPNTSRPDDITLIVWFHGLGGFSKKTFLRVYTQIKKIADHNHSIAVSIPEMPWSINTNTKRTRQGRVWMYGGEFSGFVQENIDRLAMWSEVQHNKELGSVRLVVVGHSAGGSAIAAAAKEGSLCELKPQAIIWSDASYDHWLHNAWDSCLSEGASKMHVLVRKWDTPYRRAMGFMETFKPPSSLKLHVLQRKEWTHGRIGNNALMLAKIFSPGC